MLNNNHKKTFTILNYIEHFLTLTLVFAVTVCISFSAFTSLVDDSKGILSSTTGLNIFRNVARIKKYKSTIKKKKKKYNEIALLVNTSLDCIEGLMC